MKNKRKIRKDYHLFQERKKAYIKNEYGEAGYQNLEELRNHEYTKELGNQLYRESAKRFFAKELAMSIAMIIFKYDKDYFLKVLTEK